MRPFLLLLMLTGCRDYGLLRSASTTDAATPADDGATLPDLASGGCGAAILCDGFETSMLRPYWNIVSMAPSTVTLDGSRAHRGTSSVGIHVPARDSADQSTYASLEFTITPLPAQLYVRAFFYRPSTTTDDIDLFNLEQNVTDNNGIYLVATGGQERLYQVANPPDLVTNGSTSLHADGWSCVELDVTELSSSQPLATFRVDGGPFAPPARVAGGYTSKTGLSLVQYVMGGQTTKAIDFWIDDIIVDTVPIGCER